MNRSLSGFNVLALALGLIFLYLPIGLLILYSFNASRLITVWGGFSTHWYTSIVHNSALLAAGWTSLKIAVASATLATVLGTLSGLALTRLTRFPGRALFSGLIYAPLVMPEVILGLALLLTFVALSLDRGAMTLTIAHTTFTLSYVTVVVRARLLSLDRALEEAAMDLGAPPMRVFLSVTLPLILPAVATGWLLSFILSIDDLVIASFTTGPGATTLPMRLYSQMRLGITSEINALSTILIGLAASGVLLASLILRLMNPRQNA